MPIGDILDRLEAAEKNFAGREFLAPLVGRGPVEVRIAGVVCRLKVTKGPEGPEGLPTMEPGVTPGSIVLLRALSSGTAAYLRRATLAEADAYLGLFPAVKLVLLGRAPQPGRWWAVPAQSGDRRLRFEGLPQVHLVEAGLERFETVTARFDGRQLWYERRDPARDPAIGAYLRQQLAVRAEDDLPPEAERLHKRGLSIEERQAYALARQGLSQAQQDRAETRLAAALAHAGAQLESFGEQADVYTVRYRVDGREHASLVRKDNLEIVSAGICLSGLDRAFDLASLVGVLREGAGGGRLVYVPSEGDEYD